MNTRSQLGFLRVGALALVAAMLLAVLSGCEEDSYRDHNPPAGQGSIVVDNNTGIEFDVFIDGSPAGSVGDWSERILDREPGVYRFVLTEDDGGGSFRDDIDVLDGRLTILHVEDDGSRFGGYYVWVEIED